MRAAEPRGADAAQPIETQGPAPDFNIDVPPRGYAWWYVDALSDDGRHGLTIIAFIGSVFSPYYFKGRHRGKLDPREYCAVNACLYGEQRRWAMTERGADALTQSDDALTIGPSSVRWNPDQTLTVELDEMGMPFPQRVVPQRIRGRIHVKPNFINQRVFTLDANGRHHWRPIAPTARVEVELDRPDLKWSGHAYLDRNWGAEPLEDAFAYWDWCRATLGEDESAVLYNMDRRDGTPFSLALNFAADGTISEFDPPPNHKLPRGTVWRSPRSMQADEPPRIVETLEDTPFYTRSVVSAKLQGRQAEAVHESVSLDRFTSPWVQPLLPYRMPKR
ncbi:hypothetical protein [Marichromatium purpuratum]|nr:hypothetical protein [Marichromatium purpuratum]